MNSDWTTFVQWKGTDLCMDIYCPNCGKSGHIDGMGVHAIRCARCNAIYRMPTDLRLERTSLSKVVSVTTFGADED